jgi:hypothetical protein
VQETVNWTRVYLDGGDVFQEMDREVQSFLGDAD